LFVLSKEDQPQQTGEKNSDAGVEERNWPNLSFKAIPKQQMPHDKGKNDGDRQTKHPYREERADNVDGRRTATPGARQASYCDGNQILLSTAHHF
jgi:hypothetical protein